MTTSKYKNLEKKIITDLVKTGFPLEVSVSNLLIQNGWRIESSPIYVDPEEKITRELDIYALKIYNIPSIKNLFTDPSLFSHLIIQCKKNPKPWIFFDNAGIDPYWIGFYSIKSDEMDIVSKMCNSEDKLFQKNHRYRTTKKHRSFHIYDNTGKGRNGNNDIYESLITVCKALEYYKKMYGAGNLIHIFTPVVVLDGTLWSATLNVKNIISLKNVSSLLVKFDYMFGEKQPSNLNFQYIEIITQQEFKKRIKLIEEDNNSIFETWVEHKTKTTIK